MDERRVLELARRLIGGDVAIDAFLRELAPPATVDLGNVQLDAARAARCGFPEVIFAEGKDVDTLRRTIERMVASGCDVLATRMDGDKAAALLSTFTDARYNAT